MANMLPELVIQKSIRCGIKNNRRGYFISNKYGETIGHKYGYFTKKDAVEALYELRKISKV